MDGESSVSLYILLLIVIYIGWLRLNQLHTILFLIVFEGDN
jgi:hypothetical protein